MKSKRYIIWLSPNDCCPPHGLDLSPGSSDSIKVNHLASAFLENGFNQNFPALIGYPLGGRIQLVSGTHRHEAAKRANIKLPVTLFLRSYIEAYWGTEKWLDILHDIPVRDFCHYPDVPDTPPELGKRYSPDMR